jgi:hypothetical protein
MFRYLLPVLTTAALLAITLDANAGKDITESQVPPTVLIPFKATHPAATEVEYEEEQQNGGLVYEIEYKLDGIKHKIEYTPGGKILKEETDD